MRPASELKLDFEMIRGLGDIIDVLKTAAMIQFRSFQFKEKPNTDYLDEIEACFNILLDKNIRHPYIFDRKGLPSAIVAVTSDEGFLGELNTLLVNAALDCRRSESDEMVVLGERGARYLEDMRQGFTAFPGISDEANYREAESVRNYLIKGYRKKYGRIIVVYPRFVSMTLQKVTAQQVLPFERKEIASVLTSTMSTPRNDGRAEARNDDKKRSHIAEEMLIEPTEASVLMALVEIWMTYTFMDVFWSSKQSEFAARIMHLEGSTQELGVTKQKLAFEYFRQVHNLRDKVIREISASKIMLGKRR